MRRIKGRRIKAGTNIARRAEKQNLGQDLSGLKIAKREEFFGYNAQVPLTLAEVKKRFSPPLTLGTPQKVRLACDAQLEETGVYTLLQHSIAMGQLPQCASLGYSVLQQLSQNGMVRACIETTSDDMTRNWIEIKRKGQLQESEVEETLSAREQREKEEKENAFLSYLGISESEDKQERYIIALEEEITRLKIKRLFHDAVALVGYMGGCMIYIDTGETDPEKLKEPLNVTPYSAELQQDHILRFVLVDPINVFPGAYNAVNPLREDYFTPKTWWILGTEVHESRLIRLVANEVPVLLKPSYNFFGIAQAQLLYDYVLHFNNVRIASQRLLGKFSLTVMKTDMANILTQAGGTEDLDRRIALLVRNRSNDGVQVIDKEMEDVLKLETPLSGVTDIVRQSLEMLAVMNRTPAVKLLGISPAGFNSTGESDIRNYYDHILSQQEKVLRPAIEKVLRLIQIHIFGRIDNTLTFSFAALSEADETVKVNNEKLKADTMAVLLDRQVVSTEECRRVLADDVDSVFTNIKVDDFLPENIEETSQDLNDENEENTENNTGNSEVVAEMNGKE